MIPLTIGVQFNWLENKPEHTLKHGLLSKVKSDIIIDSDHCKINFKPGKNALKFGETEIIYQELRLSLPNSSYSNIYCYLEYDHGQKDEHKITVTKLNDLQDMANNFAATDSLLVKNLKDDVRYNLYNKLFKETLVIAEKKNLKVSLEAFFEGLPGEHLVFISCMVDI